MSSDADKDKGEPVKVYVRIRPEIREGERFSILLKLVVKFMI